MDHSKIKADSKIKELDYKYKKNNNKSNFTKDIFQNNQYSYQDEKNNDSETNEWYIKGYNEGLNEGLSNEKENIQTTLKQLKNTLDELSELKNIVVHDLEKQIPMLSIAIAKKIIEKEVSIDQGIIQKIMHKILNKIEEPNEIKIRINPLDYKNLRKNDIDLTELKGLKYIPDNSISVGGCLIETNSGKIDARIENRIKMIEDAFKNLN